MLTTFPGVDDCRPCPTETTTSIIQLMACGFENDVVETDTVNNESFHAMLRSFLFPQLNQDGVRGHTTRKLIAVLPIFS